jgi:hypothetical protein
VHICELNGERPRIHKTARVLDGVVVGGEIYATVQAADLRPVQYE